MPTHLEPLLPIFFINIITSDMSKWPDSSVPMVIWELPYTWGTARETKSPSRLETELASASIF
jgi:hypothetical protein